MTVTVTGTGTGTGPVPAPVPTGTGAGTGTGTDRYRDRYRRRYRNRYRCRYRCTFFHSHCSELRGLDLLHQSFTRSRRAHQRAPFSIVGALRPAHPTTQRLGLLEGS